MDIKLIKYKVAGIYAIKCLSNNKVYIGSSINIRQRWINHVCHLRKNKHYNQHLQNSFNSYGEENFKCEVLELIEDKDILVFKENYYMDLYDSTDRNKGFNMMRETERRSHSLESKKKMSKTRKGRKVSQETKRKMKEVWTEERRAWMSNIHKNREVSLETRMKLSERGKNRIYSPEAIQNLKDSWTEDRRRNISKKLTGIKRSKTHGEGARKRMSRPILRLSLDGQILERHESIISASKNFGSASGIGNSCRDGKPRFGFLWSYASSPINLTP